MKYFIFSQILSAVATKETLQCDVILETNKMVRYS